MKNLLILSLFGFLTITGFSQTGKPAPKFQAFLAGSKGGDMPVSEIKRIIDSGLVVKDEKGLSYPVARFTVGYRFTSSYEDEASGEKKTTNDFRSQEYSDENKMSELWRESVKDNIKPGDELLLFNIMVRLKNGKKMLVNQISFKVK